MGADINSDKAWKKIKSTGGLTLNLYYRVTQYQAAESPQHRVGQHPV